MFTQFKQWYKDNHEQITLGLIVLLAFSVLLSMFTGTIGWWTILNATILGALYTEYQYIPLLKILRTQLDLLNDLEEQERQKRIKRLNPHE